MTRPARTGQTQGVALLRHTYMEDRIRKRTEQADRYPAFQAAARDGISAAAARSKPTSQEVRERTGRRERSWIA
ncbi:hypothetical protein [Rhizohabitans arisaemae]|uniref:hypothetical protein n=1 Tax=Rhizohabitans arisaemae TaxID=2720610 RepID=UPI0024B2773E|nr:hypothetical protein [Rhizohabitans arisaemae]